MYIRYSVVHLTVTSVETIVFFKRVLLFLETTSRHKVTITFEDWKQVSSLDTPRNVLGEWLARKRSFSKSRYTTIFNKTWK